MFKKEFITYYLFFDIKMANPYIYTSPEGLVDADDMTFHLQDDLCYQTRSAISENFLF